MDTSSLRPHLRVLLFGSVLGFSLSGMGFSNFGEIHRMFTFADFRLLFTFLGAVAFCMIGMKVFARGCPFPQKHIHKGTVAGGVIFGVGWALTGSCPSVALVQLGEGRLPALATLAGVMAGTVLYKKVHARFFRWDTGACE